METKKTTLNISVKNYNKLTTLPHSKKELRQQSGHSNDFINLTRTYLNPEYVNIDVETLINEEMEDVRLQNNIKHARKDRQIQNYYREKVTTSKKSKPFTELVVKVGSSRDILKDDKSEITEENIDVNSQLYNERVKALDLFAERFTERFPELKTFYSTQHVDEANPHLHVFVVPFGQTSGGKKSISLINALNERYPKIKKTDRFKALVDDMRDYLLKDLNEVAEVTYERAETLPDKRKQLTDKEYKDALKSVQELARSVDERAEQLNKREESLKRREKQHEKQRENENQQLKQQNQQLKQQIQQMQQQMQQMQQQMQQIQQQQAKQKADDIYLTLEDLADLSNNNNMTL